MHDHFGSLSQLDSKGGKFAFYRLSALEDAGFDRVPEMPFSLRILLESVLRQIDGRSFKEEDVAALASWQPNAPKQPEVPFLPARVIMQDLTGLPAISWPRSRPLLVSLYRLHV